MGSGNVKPQFSMKGLSMCRINLSLAGRVWQWEDKPQYSRKCQSEGRTNLSKA